MPLDQHSEDKEMSFFDHLDALRKHLVRSAFAIAIFMVGAFVYMDYLFHGIMMGPIRNNFISYRAICALSNRLYGDDRYCVSELDLPLLNTEMAGHVMMAFKLAFLAGIICAFPYMLWQLWLFIKPALSSAERKNTRGFVFYTTFLFLCGVSFGYFILCPISVNFLASYSISPLIEDKISITNIVSFMTLIVLGTGLIFELPILMYFLGKIGLVTSKFLKKYRKHALVLILITSAIFTPPDVVSQIVLTIPLYSLFELGITIVKRVEKQNEIKNEP